MPTTRRTTLGYEPRRICLIKPSALGDVVQSLPVFAALRRRYPRAHIAWLVNSAYAPLLEPIPQLDEVIEFDRHVMRAGVWRGLRDAATFVRGLSERRFDLAVDLQGLAKSGAFTLATRAHRRVGLASAREGAGIAYTHVVDDRAGSPAAVERYWKVAEFLDADGPKEFALALTHRERAEAARSLHGLPRPIVAAQPGAQWETKRWPAANFAASLQRTLAAGGSAVILGGPGEEPIAAAVADALSIPNRNLAGKTSLRLLAAVLESCDLALTNDSGPMHLAAAVGTPTVAVFTCTAPERAGPFGSGHRIVQTAVDCRASYVKRCAHLSCMKELTAERVIPALAAALAEVRRQAG
jgi:lipopolysaccharide heptosyltransferase II